MIGHLGGADGGPGQPRGCKWHRQLCVLTRELKPTGGDILKSPADMRVAMLQQEFVDKIDMTRMLR